MDTQGAPDDTGRGERARAQSAQVLATAGPGMPKVPEPLSEASRSVADRRRLFGERLQRALERARALDEPLGEVDYSAMHAASDEFNQATFYRLRDAS